MKPNPFRFKQFIVHHDRCAMKVGTDAVLLGAWTRVEGAKNILDIGTGSGIIALMIAQRTLDGVVIDAVEIGRPDFLQACENVEQSPWPDKIKVYHSSIQEYQPSVRYDLILCNPPYFVNSLLPPADGRKQARHTTSLTHDDLLRVAHRSLKPDGVLALILPAEEGAQFLKRSEDDFGFFPMRQLAVFTRPGKAQERLLMELSRQKLPFRNESLIMHENGNERSDRYQALTHEFYLATGSSEKQYP